MKINTTNISQYSELFHDGSIIDISHNHNSIIIAMESAEIDKQDLIADITLSKDDSIKGKLYINRVRNITINDEPFLGILKREYDHGSIFELSIKKNFVEICVEWIDFPPNTKKEDFSIIRIEAQNIYWENIPDLPD